MAQLPVRDSVGAAFRFVRENLRFILLMSGAGAAAVTVIGGLTLAAPALGLVTTILSTLVQAFVYAALIGAALFGGAPARTRWTADGGRVWVAMALIGLFLFIVMFVVSIVASIVLVAGPLGPYLEDLQSAGNDNAAIVTVMTRFAEANPLALLLLMLFVGAIWMFLTSRLYLSAPATVDKQRILTFETWSWTKGAMLRITWARLSVLLPAYVFMFAVSQLLARLLGIDILDPVAAQAFATANPVVYLGYAFVTSFVSLFVYSALEAGLSSYIYRGLKPDEALAPAA
jgi:hypothetical protein